VFEFSVVPGTVVKSILEEDPRHWIATVEDAYLTHHDGLTVNPDSYFLRFPDAPINRIIALPAALKGNFDVAGIKWIASYPKNIERGIARASAVLLLNDMSTGYPFACLEGAGISAVRTAASAVLGAYRLNACRRVAPRIAFIGTGVIARHIMNMFIADEWQIGEVLSHDLDRFSAEAFVSHVADAGIPAVREAALDRALEADIVVFATNAGTPYVDPSRRFKAGQVVLNISLRDLAPESLLDANNVFDDVDHCMKAATSPHLAEQLSGGRSFVTGTIAQLIRGEIAIDLDRASIYSPFGMGMLDLALGVHVHQRALAQKRTVEIPGFFGETQRW
jgi:2,3-diaminopropionate biosynthesis protein SbnB